MSTWILAHWIVMVVPAGAEASATPVAGIEQRSPHELRRDISAAMRQEALAKSESERAACIRHLCRLYGQLNRNTRMAEFNRKQSISKLRNRLRRIERDLKKDIARRDKQAGRSRVRETGHDESSFGSISDESLAILSAQLGWVSDSMGGPAALFARAGGGPGGAEGPADDGQALVELIQATITPGIWDVNGGSATIVYFAPLHALVIRAPGGVHRRTGELLNQLRAAGQ